jgi:hypothetical protein
MFGLRPADLQYKVRHHSTDCFKIGEVVFVTLDPNLPVKVVKVKENEVIISNPLTDGTFQICSLPPECLLQYKYAGLIVYKKQYDICLN